MQVQAMLPAVGKKKCSMHMKLAKKFKLVKNRNDCFLPHGYSDTHVIHSTISHMRQQTVCYKC